MVLSDLDCIFIKAEGLNAKEVETALKVFQRSFKLISVSIRKHGGC